MAQGMFAPGKLALTTPKAHARRNERHTPFSTAPPEPVQPYSVQELTEKSPKKTPFSTAPQEPVQPYSV
eukprot:2123205-Rhodomonas_salina.2